MIKKYSLDEVREVFRLEGYTLLSNEYINNKTKLYYLCPNGHKHSVLLTNWITHKHRCPICKIKPKKTNSLIILDKYDIMSVKRLFESEGYKLISSEYINNRSPLDYICPNGHVHKVSLAHWLYSNSRCPYCSNSVKYDFEYVKKVFKDRGFKLLSKIYNNNKEKLKCVCDKGHVVYMSFYSVKTGKGCSICKKNKQFSIDEVKSFFEQDNYKLLTDKYKNNRSILWYICPEGHRHKTNLFTWRQGRRCPTCKGIKISIERTGSGHPNWQGGISCEPYCPVWSDKRYKNDIKIRDNNTCQNPYCYGTSSKLVIHHIDYDKKNCAPENLITLCNGCNSRANVDREWHKAWYKILMSKRCGVV